MKTLNGKTPNEMSNAEWTALETERECERLRDRVRDQIAYCRRRLDEAERHLNEPEYRFPHSSGVLTNAASELDTVAAQYATAQGMAASLLRSVESDHRMAHPDPGEGVVAFIKFVRRQIGLPALPPDIGARLQHRTTSEVFEVTALVPAGETQIGDVWLRRLGAPRRSKPFAADSSEYEIASPESIQVAAL